MSVELDRSGSGVAALMLTVSTLFALKRNGALADSELIDIVEQSLARLKALDRGQGVRSQTAWETAVYLLEQLRTHLARDRNWERLNTPPSA